MIYQKTLKGAEEIALRTHGMSMRLRPYLLVVDGTKSLDQLIVEYPGLPELELILRGLEAEGYIALRGAAMQGVQQPARMAASGGGNVVQLSTPPSASASPLPAAMPSAALDHTSTPMGTRSPGFDYRKSQIIGEVSRILGRDAPPVIAKVQSCATEEQLFALLMGLKKIISMYASPADAEAFFTRHSKN
jgi:hypothetical protein